MDGQRERPPPGDPERLTVPVVELADATLHCERAGSGPPLLICSGTGSDTRRPPGPFSWPGADRFDAVAYDHRGLGQSVDREAGDPTMDGFAADALALADHLGWERFSLIGISFGGMVAQEVALAGGERVHRLVLAVTSPGGAGGSSFALDRTYRLAPQERVEQMIRVLDTRAATDPAVYERMKEWMTSDAVGGDGEVPEGLVRQLRARSHHDTWERLPTLRVPTLVLAGRYDGVAVPDTVARLAAQIPGARLVVRDGGHTFLRGDREAWNEIVAFLLDG
jgi:3-oxoadipate enol-lactonase